jgi:hypothetical protein
MSAGNPVQPAVPVVAVGSHDSFTIDFIDPLFAVILHIGFVRTVVDMRLYLDFDTLYTEHKVTIRALGLLVLGFMNILLSWHGYHRSVLEKPIRGGMRFYVDVLCLLIYLFIVLEFQSLQNVAWLLVAQFVLFWLWDGAKALEYRGSGVWRTGLRTFGWGLLFVAIAALATWAPKSSNFEVIVDASLIGLMFLGSTGYRFHKAMRPGMTIGEAINNWLYGSRLGPAKA